MNEEWKNIKGYEGLYQISNLGRVKSFPRKGTGTKNERILKQVDDGKGYFQVCLHKKNKGKSFKIHRLVAEQFIQNPNNYTYINHINEIKTDNRIENLEWCTQKHNMNCGTVRKRIIEGNKKKIMQLSMDNKFIKIFSSSKEASNELNLDTGGICKCLKGIYKSCGGFKWRYYENI